MRANTILGALLALWVILGGIPRSVAGDRQLLGENVRAGAIPASSSLPQDVFPASDPPPGYVGFCLRFKDQCVALPKGPRQITLSPGAWANLGGVNRTINRLIKPMSDLRHYGVLEYWTIPRDGFGDCEDYALAKRAVLVSIGFPRSALRIAVVNATTGEAHAVLTIVTDHGDYVLDNLTDAVRGWRDTGYTWIERQDPSTDSGWVLFEHPAGKVITASTGLKK